MVYCSFVFIWFDLQFVRLHYIVLYLVVEEYLCIRLLVIVARFAS